ncbi:hypothetical protein LL036_03680 [Clostridium sp. CF011]|uniref:hypothetical protein n=1 Tax=Clostridium sp. CF011 TaxID=2843318 RepID=UPI00227A5761|nr:hypothetical protein [Clostridium sp. CF011]WAG70555.1 hypothetical protein LL036_03680 [Clostridium sp. CF011]
MKIRIRSGKGNKERYTLLSERNLELLSVYWRGLGRKNYSMLRNLSYYYLDFTIFLSIYIS